MIRGYADEMTAQVEVLTAQLAAAQAEVEKWKDEYQNVCKFANDYESQRDALRAEVESLKAEVHRRAASHGLHITQTIEPKLMELEAEVALARERLGPAGWKMLRDIPAMQAVVDAGREVVRQAHKPDEGVPYLGVALAHLERCLSALDDARGEG